MPRTFIACLATETNTFAPLPTGRLAFQENGIVRDASRQQAHYGASMLEAWRRLAEAQGHDVIESLSAFAQPGGTTTRPIYEELRDAIVDDLRTAQADGPVDLVLLALHGAMVAEGYDDCEGDLLSRLRAVAPTAVIGAELDLHCHLTDAMLHAADWVIACKEYPHIDHRERSEELFGLAERTRLGQVRPVAAWVDTRMVGFYPTFVEPMQTIVAELRAAEQQPGLLSASIGHGFPWADVADVGTRIWAYADGDEALARDAVMTLARRMYGARDALQLQMPGIEQALDLAAAHPGRVVLGDYADNPGGGAPGDSTFFLRAMLRRGVTQAAIGSFWDPVAVNLCADAGEGAALALRLGGKVGPMSGDPLDIHVQVMRIVENHSQGRFGARQEMGRSVWLRLPGIDIVVNTQRSQAFDPDLFTGMGISLDDKRLIVVKSSNHFEAGFRPIADHLWRVASPGTLQLNLGDLPYTKRDACYHPRVEDPWAQAGDPSIQIIAPRRRATG